MRLGVDVGGTFTDAVLINGGALVSAKAPTTPDDQSRGVIEAIDAVLKRAGAAPAEVTELSHGMTVATNALLEGRGAETAFVGTEGFEDIVALGRQDRPHLYRLCEGRPAPLSRHRFGAPERMTPEGPLRPLSVAAARRLAGEIAAVQPQSVAVTLLHAYRHPQHELALREALAHALPGVHVSLSHEVAGTFREYERAATTEVDAALSPLLAGYLGRLAQQCAASGLPRPSIMQSNGGLVDLEAAAGHAAWTVLSGPAGGAAAAAHLARASGVPDALCFDMGGTSCDVCVVQDDAVQERGSGMVAGRPLALPMVAVHTVGAGGGSIAWRDGGGALRVGPRSAGSDPGPACYGRGGAEPTVTDANLLLGRLAADARLAGGPALALRAARRAIEPLARSLGCSVARCAEGIVQVADAEMVRALRVVTVARGIDPRRFALLCFGGAGPLHAISVARELGISKVICPRASGVLAALGLLVAPRRRDAQRTVMLRGDALSGVAVAQHVAQLGDRARAQLRDADAQLRAVYELRYAGQSFELAVAGPPAPSPDELRSAFEDLHERRYGYRDPEQELELVTVRVSASVPGSDVTLGGAGAGGPRPGDTIAGPAVVALPESTLFVPDDWRGEVDANGTIHLQERA